MRIREDTPNAIFKAFCAFALAVWCGDHKKTLSYLLFGMGFSWLALVAAEMIGWVEIIRPSTSQRNEEVCLNICCTMSTLRMLI